MLFASRGIELIRNVNMAFEAFRLCPKISSKHTGRFPGATENSCGGEDNEEQTKRG
jgi:hypothetical protein